MGGYAQKCRTSGAHAGGPLTRVEQGSSSGMYKMINYVDIRTEGSGQARAGDHAAYAEQNVYLPTETESAHLRDSMDTGCASRISCFAVSLQLSPVVDTADAAPLTQAAETLAATFFDTNSLVTGSHVKVYSTAFALRTEVPVVGVGGDAPQNNEQPPVTARYYIVGIFRIRTDTEKGATYRNMRPCRALNWVRDQVLRSDTGLGDTFTVDSAAVIFTACFGCVIAFGCHCAISAGKSENWTDLNILQKQWHHKDASTIYTLRRDRVTSASLGAAQLLTGPTPADAPVNGNNHGGAVGAAAATVAVPSTLRIVTGGPAFLTLANAVDMTAAPRTGSDRRQLAVVATDERALEAVRAFARALAGSGSIVTISGTSGVAAQLATALSSGSRGGACGVLCIDASALSNLQSTELLNWVASPERYTYVRVGRVVVVLTTDHIDSMENASPGLFSLVIRQLVTESRPDNILPITPSRRRRLLAHITPASLNDDEKRIRRAHIDTALSFF